MHYELNTGALLSAAIGQSLLGNWSTATEFHLSHRWEPGIRPQLTINSWLWAEKGVVGLWEVVVKGSVCWEVTVIQVSSSCSLLHSFLPHWRAGHIHALQFGTLILQVDAMYEMQLQCKFLLWWLHLRIPRGAHPPLLAPHPIFGQKWSSSSAAKQSFFVPELNKMRSRLTA